MDWRPIDKIIVAACAVGCAVLVMLIAAEHIIGHPLIGGGS